MPENKNVTENRGTRGTFRKLKARRKNYLKRLARRKRRLFSKRGK